MFIHQNNSFVLFGSYVAKDRYAYEFLLYCNKLQQVSNFSRSGVKLNIHYNMIAFIIA